MADTQEATKAKRKKFCIKVYVNTDGKETRHANPEVDRLEFRFTNGNVLAVKLKDIGKGCAKGAAWHGIAQKIGDSYNKVETADEAEENAEAMLERLNSDEWVKAGEGAGPKTGVLVQAIENACVKSGSWEVDKNGVTVPDEARTEANRVKVSDKAGREGAMENASIKAEYKQLQAESAAKRAQDAAKKAKGTTDTLKGF